MVVVCVLCFGGFFFLLKKALHFEKLSLDAVLYVFIQFFINMSTALF